MDGTSPFSDDLSSLPPPMQVRLRFSAATRETPSVTTFRFGLSTSGFRYLSNQFVFLGLPGLSDPRGPWRRFSVSSSPTETDVIAITTRMTGSPYKERLASMRPGEEVVVRGPFGNFLLDTSRAAVMLAGGVGISPFRGMIRYAADTHLEIPIVLVYANSIPEEITFREELEDVARTLGSLRIVNTITRPAESSRPWKGRTGRIDPDMIRESTRGLHDALYYVCGTPGFVDSLVTMLIDQVDVDERDIRLERFLGY